MLELITNSVSSEQFAATARATQDVGRISGRVYRARNASLARPTVCLRWGKYFFRTLLSNVMKSVINGKFVGNDFRWHLEVHERPCGCQDSSPRIFTSLYGGEPHIKGSRSSK